MHALKSEFTNLSFLQHPLESASHAHGTIQGCSTDPVSMIQGYNYYNKYNSRCNYSRLHNFRQKNFSDFSRIFQGQITVFKD